MATTENQHGHRATHPRLHIRNAHEAHTLFEAVRLGLLPIVRRRLSPTDRELQSGEVFVWEEASYKGGLERWTDGRKWSQSRMREPFLFYEEKAMPSREEKDAKAARRARKSSDPSSPASGSATLPSSPSPPRRQDRPTKPKGLTKQTYSAFVHAPNAPAGQAPKKWHLTAYFCSATYHELPVCADDPVLRDVTVPENVYVTGKGLTRKNGSQRGVDRKESSTPAPPVQQMQAPPSQAYFPPPPPHHYPHEAPVAPASYGYPPHPQFTHHRPAPPPSESPSAPADDSASTFDSGSRSPWSSSSSAMPVTPPPQPYSAYGPPTAYPPPPNAYGPPHPAGYAPPYYAPQPHYAPPSQPQPYVYETAVPAVKNPEPVVYDSTPRPSSTLPPLPRYEDAPMKTPLPPAPATTALPPPVSAPQSYPGPPPSTSPSSVLPNPSYPPPPPHTPFQSHFSAAPGTAGSQYSPGHAQPVGYSTSDVRGEAPPSPTGSARSAGSTGTGPRYVARHSLDQKAIGAFKVTL